MTLIQFVLVAASQFCCETAAVLQEAAGLRGRGLLSGASRVGLRVPEDSSSAEELRGDGGQVQVLAAHEDAVRENAMPAFLSTRSQVVSRMRQEHPGDPYDPATHSLRFDAKPGSRIVDLPCCVIVSGVLFVVIMVLAILAIFIYVKTKEKRAAYAKLAQVKQINRLKRQKLMLLRPQAVLVGRKGGKGGKGKGKAGAVSRGWTPAEGIGSRGWTPAEGIGGGGKATPTAAQAAVPASALLGLGSATTTARQPLIQNNITVVTPPEKSLAAGKGGQPQESVAGPPQQPMEVTTVAREVTTETSTMTTKVYTKKQDEAADGKFAAAAPAPAIIVSPQHAVAGLVTAPVSAVAGGATAAAHHHQPSMDTTTSDLLQLHHTPLAASDLLFAGPREEGSAGELLQLEGRDTGVTAADLDFATQSVVLPPLSVEAAERALRTLGLSAGYAHYLAEQVGTPYFKTKTLTGTDKNPGLKKPKLVKRKQVEKVVESTSKKLPPEDEKARGTTTSKAGETTAADSRRVSEGKMKMENLVKMKMQMKKSTPAAKTSVGTARDASANVIGSRGAPLRPTGVEPEAADENDKRETTTKQVSSKTSVQDDKKSKASMKGDAAPEKTSDKGEGGEESENSDGFLLLPPAMSAKLGASDGPNRGTVEAAQPLAGFLPGGSVNKVSGSMIKGSMKEEKLPSEKTGSAVADQEVLQEVLASGVGNASGVVKSASVIKNRASAAEAQAGSIGPFSSQQMNTSGVPLTGEELTLDAVFFETNYLGLPPEGKTTAAEVLSDDEDTTTTAAGSSSDFSSDSEDDSLLPGRTELSELAAHRNMTAHDLQIMERLQLFGGINTVGKLQRLLHRLLKKKYGTDAHGNYKFLRARRVPVGGSALPASATGTTRGASKVVASVVGVGPDGGESRSPGPAEFREPAFRQNLCAEYTKALIDAGFSIPAAGLIAQKTVQDIFAKYKEKGVIDNSKASGSAVPGTFDFEDDEAFHEVLEKKITPQDAALLAPFYPDMKRERVLVKPRPIGEASTPAVGGGGATATGSTTVVEHDSQQAQPPGKDSTFLDGGTQQVLFDLGPTEFAESGLPVFVLRRAAEKRVSLDLSNLLEGWELEHAQKYFEQMGFTSDFARKLGAAIFGAGPKPSFAEQVKDLMAAARYERDQVLLEKLIAGEIVPHRALVLPAGEQLIRGPSTSPPEPRASTRSDLLARTSVGSSSLPAAAEVDATTPLVLSPSTPEEVKKAAIRSTLRHPEQMEKIQNAVRNDIVRTKVGEYKQEEKKKVVEKVERRKTCGERWCPCCCGAKRNAAAPNPAVLGAAAGKGKGKGKGQGKSKGTAAMKGDFSSGAVGVSIKNKNEPPLPITIAQGYVSSAAPLSAEDLLRAAEQGRASRQGGNPPAEPSQSQQQSVTAMLLQTEDRQAQEPQPATAAAAAADPPMKPPSAASIAVRAASVHAQQGALHSGSRPTTVVQPATGTGSALQRDFESVARSTRQTTVRKTKTTETSVSSKTSDVLSKSRKEAL